MVKNLSQLKKSLKTGAQFRVIKHARQECVGEEREVTYANSQGFFSIVPGNPNCRTSLANNGRGSHNYWSKAPFWEFKDGVCSLYASDTRRTEECLIMSLEVMEQEAA